MKRVVWILLAALLLFLQPAFAQSPGSGSLKVTSFPAGAEVLVNGVSTGKLTPMSVSLPVGQHQVTVQIPGSGWSPATSIVDVASGTNDLT